MEHVAVMIVPHYFSRCLTYTDSHYRERVIDDASLLEFPTPKVVLGEPGMGKSELMSELGRLLKVKVTMASHFMHHPDPGKLIECGKPLLIDGLDEVMARQEGDAIDFIMARLDALDSPDVILSCRAREWQSRNLTGLKKIYVTEPVIFHLQPFDRVQASAFLAQRYKAVDAGRVLNHLNEQGVPQLYHNPLTLDLMGQVALRDSELPATRSALFERVCKLIWPEHDPERGVNPLRDFTDEQALGCAGAIMAGMLVAGAQAIHLGRTAFDHQNDITLVELSVLPGVGTHARAIVSSKLFQNIDIDRVRPVHRVIAEFLAARWLARQADNSRKQRRLLAQFQGDGKVPASFRGLHAWIAYHRPILSSAVIAFDPLGVLRYGETTHLGLDQARHLFESLKELSKTDPYFRVHDWDSHTAKGLMIASLRDDIEEVILSKNGNKHLSSLLLDSLNGTELALTLEPTLAAIMMDAGRGFSERRSAAGTLGPLYDAAQWDSIITRLLAQRQEDSIELARNLVDVLDVEVSDELVTATVLAELGIPVPVVARGGGPKIHRLHDYSRLISGLAPSKLGGVLTRLSGAASQVDSCDWQSASELNGLLARLITRAIDEQVVTCKKPSMLWEWLLGLSRPQPEFGAVLSLQNLLDSNTPLRRAVQHYVLYEKQRNKAIFDAELDLEQHLVGLRRNPDDLVFFIRRLGECDSDDPATHDDWVNLMMVGSIGSTTLTSALWAASRDLPRGEQWLEAFAARQKRFASRLTKPPRNRAEGKRRRILNLKFKLQLWSLRRRYRSEGLHLRAGELAVILEPAMQYLGALYPVPAQIEAKERLLARFGESLANDMMAGFEATLHRSDLPSPQAVALYLVDDELFEVSAPIVAGLLARLRGGHGFTDLPKDLLIVGLLLCKHPAKVRLTADRARYALREELERIAIATDAERMAFARCWIEPALAAGNAHIPGIDWLASDEKCYSTGRALAAEWLVVFPTAHPKIEDQLIDILISSKDTSVAAAVAQARVAMVFDDEDRLFTWLAVDLLVRFDLVVEQLEGMGDAYPYVLWYLRQRFQPEQNRVRSDLSAPQAKWVLSQFRRVWPQTQPDECEHSEFSAYQASQFLCLLIEHLAVDTSDQASEAMMHLIAEPPDSYSDLIRHLATEQQQKRAEENVRPVLPHQLAELLSDGPPSNADDLKALIVEELAVAQKIIAGDELDQIRDFWSDTFLPYDENRCRDRLAVMLGAGLSAYEIFPVSEVDMPNSKRVDLAFECGTWRMPMEVKGQWHDNVWQAATRQLDAQYLIDWRSAQRGIYCVLWFGPFPSSSNKQLTPPPAGLNAPTSAGEMCDMLIELIPPARRALIDVVVLDFSHGGRIRRSSRSVP